MKKIIKVVSLLFLLCALFACGKEEVKPETIEVNGVLEYYSKGVTIDLNNIKVVIKYSNEETKEYSLYDEEVTYDDFTTTTVGKRTITISCLGLSKTIEYEVVEYVVTLDFQDGTFDGAQTKSLTADNKLVDVSDIIPIPNDDTKEFAGWFLDKELTTRAEAIYDNTYSVNNNMTLYAGYDTNYGDLFEYEINDNGEVILTSYDILSSFEEAIVIPETIKLYPVVEIADGFIDESMSVYAWWIESLVFSENSKVTKIGKKAFYYLPITSLQLPNSLERIDDEAFEGIQITNLTLPKKLKYLGKKAFYGCSFLLDVDFNDSNLITIGNYCFASCINLTYINLSDYIETIGSYAFSSCYGLVGVSISKSVTEIGIGAFANLPSLISINVDEKNTSFSSVDGNLYDKNVKTFYRYCYGKQDTTFELPSTVVTLFEACFDLISEKSSLMNVVLNEGLVEIAGQAFKNTALNFTIPSTVSKVGFGAFYNWNGSEFKVDENNRYFKVSNKCLVSKDGTILYAVPGGITDEQFVLPKEIKEIKSYAFGSCPQIKTIVIGEDSQLSIVEEYGINPFFMSNFVSLVILKNEPFTLADNAFTGDSTTILNDTFAIIISSNIIDAYKTAWANYSSFVDRDLLSLIIAPDEYFKNVVNSISDLSYVTSIDSFTKYNEVLIKLNDNTQYDMLKNIQATNNVMALFNDIDIYTDYLANVYQAWVMNQLEYFLTSDVSVLTNVAYTFNNFEIAYNGIPEKIKAKFTLASMIENQMETLKNKYIEITSKRSEIISKLLTFEFDANSFDNDAYLKLMEEYEEYALSNYRLGNYEFIRLYILDCSHKMYELLNKEYNYENYEYLYNIYYGNEAYGIFGVQNYLNTYLELPIYYNLVYQIDKLGEIEEKLVTLETDTINYVTDFFNDFEHPETYDSDEYAKAIAVYERLGSRTILLDYNVHSKYQLVKARQILNEFIELAKTGITDENLNELNQHHDLISYYCNDEANNEFVINLTEYNLFVEYETPFLEFYSDVVDNFVNLVNQINSETIKDAFPLLEEEYNSYKIFYDSLLINVAGYTVGFGILVNIIKCAYLIDIVVDIPVSEENYLTIFSYVNGDMEGGIEDILSNEGRMYYFHDIFNAFADQDSVTTYTNNVRKL